MTCNDQQMKATKKISIITVCLNEKAKIEKTIQSVLAQTFRDYEFLIIDGGSTDGTLDMIAKYEDRIDLLISEEDHGIYHAMNKGIISSHGEYLLFLNGGDYLFDKSTLENIFKNRPSADIIYGDLMFDDTEGRAHTGECFVAKPQRNISFLSFFYPRTTLYHPGSIIKKCLFFSHGLYCEKFKLLGDYEFFIRVIGRHKVSRKYLPITLSVFNTLGASSKKETQLLRKQERKTALKRNIPAPMYYYFIFIFWVDYFLFKKIKKHIKRVIRYRDI